MLFAKKSTTAARGTGEPSLDIVDVTDVTDVTDIAEVTEVPNAAAEKAPEAESNAAPARGVFLNAKPAAAESNKAVGGLRERFLRKPVAAAKSPAAPAKHDQKPDEAKPAASTRFKWPRKAAEAVSVAAPVTAPVADQGPIGPTEKVRKPIIVRKANDKKRKFQELPIRVYMGFLPEVSERDARDYALGIAERNCEQISLVFYDAFKMANGYAYEVHEGGSGRAYLPEIIEHFASQGRFEKGGADASVYIRTATRMVQVERTHEGLQAFQLPESAAEAPSDWLEGSSKMTAAIQTMTSVLVVGAALFTTGFLALSLSLVSRIQPYDPAPAPTVERATDGYNVSPLSRWTTLQGVNEGEYVKALRFSHGKWELDRGTAPTEAAPAAAEQSAAPPAATTN